MNQSLVTIDITTFELSEHDNLVIQSIDGYVEFSHVREGSKAYLLAKYSSGRWIFNDIRDRSLFLQLMQTYPKEFRRAFKKYFQSKTRSKYYTITCARRKFTIWSQKLNSSIWDSIYNTFYGR